MIQHQLQQEVAEELHNFLEMELDEFEGTGYNLDAIYTAVQAIVQLSPEERFALEVVTRHATKFINSEIEIPCVHSHLDICGCKDMQTRRKVLYG